MGGGDRRLAAVGGFVGYGQIRRCFDLRSGEAEITGGHKGVLAITQSAPLWAAIFVWELARPPLWLLLVFLTAASSTYCLRLLVKRSRGLLRP